MKIDFLKNAFELLKQYAGVEQNQGRVQLDSDWNQQAGIADTPDELVSADQEPSGSSPVSNDVEWKYVSVRRYAVYLEDSLQEGTEWAVFEPKQEFQLGRASGKIAFGDGETGKAPKSDDSKIKAAYRTGAGETDDDD